MGLGISVNENGEMEYVVLEDEQIMEEMSEQEPEIVGNGD